jgi:uncharacterized membrane protein
MTGPVEAPSAAPRPRRGLWIALIASLAVNVFVLGWVASSYVYGPRFVPTMRVGTAGAPGMAFQHRRAVRALSGSDRETANRLWRESYPALREKLQSLRQAHLDLRAVFAADQADAKSLGDAVAALKEKANVVFDQANATLVKIGTTLSPEARKAYFNAGFPRPRERNRDRSERNDR